ncbi:Mitochondrial inner membrane magnesium transporter MRS2 [Tolypocladium ophioglossoides CBS 100239]|uniref:Magnesium transporter n=1 Tax=Tolypocladium ophioglossoides (strain CBS 100239) TaxID=1163406 RepID=A0A0L0MXE8_TOLOC|nr:Mitochondrial inner membrane magnesium transporter MRS2 [Tolypocladium ophioglossoides CBS 100239]
MPPALRRPAPSRSLLRFLRAQTDAAFSGPRRAYTSAATGAPLRRRARAVVESTGGPRCLTTACGRPLTAPPGRLSRSRGGPSPARLGLCTTAAARKLHEPGVKPDREPTWQERLWGRPARKGAKPLKPDDLPSHVDFEHGSSMFNSRRVLAAKAALEPRLRCTEVDENGKVILVDGEFKKSALIAKVGPPRPSSCMSPRLPSGAQFGLLPRDLRKIDSSNLPHILVRPSAILLNLLHLKVLIKNDRVLLFDVYGSKTSYPQSAFMYDLQGKLQQKTSQGSNALPYEFRALEAVLTSVTSEMEADFEAVREPVMHILSELEDDIDREKLRVLLILSKRVSTFEQKARLVRDAMEELLEADDDLAAMYLTEQQRDLSRELDDHTEVEMLLESYHKITDEIVQEAGNLVVRAILDANRNALMLLDLKFSVGTLGLAMGTFLAGLYGMNLENFIEETNWGFGAVTSTSTIFSLIVCWYGRSKLRKVQRIRMMSGERPHMPRALPYRDDGALGLLDSRNREMLRRAHLQRAMATKKSWLAFWR